MPITFMELGAKEEDIPLMVEKLGLGENGTMGSFVPLRLKMWNRYTVCLIIMS